MNLELSEQKLTYFIERSALDAWPGLEVASVNGWLLRHANGITRRANSVWPNDGHEDIDLEQAVVEVEAFYRERGLPARFQICPAAQPRQLDDFLAQRGYRAVARTAVQSCPTEALLERFDPLPNYSVEVSTDASPQWWECYAEADEVTSDSLKMRQAICAAIQVPALYASVIHNSKVITVGSAVANNGWIGFFNIATLKEYRRLGAARALMYRLSQWGDTQGASNAYLQVMNGNEHALRLYERVGFTTIYHYHYREETSR